MFTVELVIGGFILTKHWEIFSSESGWVQLDERTVALTLEETFDRIRNWLNE